jgi:DNA polymerase-3 subunit epsilon
MDSSPRASETKALDSKKILFIDCQTTGMHPSTGHLLEIAWVAQGETRAFLLRLPEGEEIPPRVQEITSISESDLEAAVDPEIALSALETDLEEMGEGAVLVAHYAQFERAFLEQLFQEKRGAGIPVRFLCTYKIAQKLFPQIPSRNIRALMGYFELGSGEIKRAAQHAGATALLWKHLEQELGRLGINSVEAMERWLAEKKKKSPPAKIEYRMDRIKRLELPDSPGVYRMLSQDGRVLYVGKATSLRARVNSYFRGRKGRDRKKLEMLAQVWDIKVTECPSSLEAALLENEEIKRLDPPYNVSLRAGRRKLLLYSRDFRAASFTQDKAHNF